MTGRFNYQPLKLSMQICVAFIVYELTCELDAKNKDTASHRRCVISAFVIRSLQISIAKLAILKPL